MNVSYVNNKKKWTFSGLSFSALNSLKHAFFVIWLCSILVDEKGRQIVKLLEQSDIDEESYTINDIVLPQPGFEMVYPGNSIKDFYKELLTANGMDINDLRRKQKDFSLPGKYRYTFCGTDYVA